MSKLLLSLYLMKSTHIDKKIAENTDLFEIGNIGNVKHLSFHVIAQAQPLKIDRVMVLK